MTDGKKALLGMAAIEVLLLLIVVVGGAIVVGATDKLTWEDYLQDIMVLAGTLGIGGGIAAAGLAASNGRTTGRDHRGDETEANKPEPLESHEQFREFPPPPGPQSSGPPFGQPPH